MRVSEATTMRLAGSVYVEWCYDIYRNLIHRDAPNGTPFAWDADHIDPVCFGGPDHAQNMRAVASSHNRSLGGLLGNALRRE